MRKNSRLPGVLLALLAAGVCLLISSLAPVVSALLLAIAVGILLGSTRKVPQWALPGIGWSSKKFLRFGIVLLGLQLSLTSLAQLGFEGILLLLFVVAITFFGTLLIGRALKVSRVSRFLIATGFSICGASAVAAMSSVIDPKQESEEEVAQAVALVTLYGTLCLFLLPVLGPVVGLTMRESGMWIGASVHEVAQVVAAASAMSAATLAIATVAKLGRVVILAPLVAAVGMYESYRDRGNRRLFKTDGTGGRRPPIVPLYVIGFLGMILVRSFVPIPPEILQVSSFLTTLLLAVAMFALGTGVDLLKLMRTGGRPALLGAGSTFVAVSVSLLGIFLIRSVG